MTEYYLRELDDGRTDLVEIIPAVIATFTSRAHAERYCAILMAELATEAEPQSAPSSQTVATAPAQAETDQESPVLPTEEEWRQACVAIAGGSQMKEIASMLGVSFYQLRGKYGAWKRKQKAAAGGTETTEVQSPEPAPAEEWKEADSADPETEPTPGPHQPQLPAVPAQTAISRSVSLIPLDIEPANCRLCDHPFNASACSDGLCARCHNDRGY